MKKYFQIFVSVAMAVMVLISTISWHVEKHYCMGHLMDVSLFAKSDGCGMAEMSSNAEDTDNLKLEKTCCTNEVMVLEGQENLQHTFDGFELTQPFLELIISTFDSSVFSFTSEKTDICDTYPPPILSKDICVLHQVFLI